MKELPIGLRGQAQTTVAEGNTAIAVGSGTLPVFATPAMLALIEQAAWQSVAPYLDAGESTVGTLLQVSHDSATPPGLTVRAETELTAVEGRKLVFSVTASDDAGPIGQGTHERFLVYDEKFLARAAGKAAAAQPGE